ncbi:MAG: GNAT family N-acetyltransferase [Phycisphaerales bacterium]
MPASFTPLDAPRHLDAVVRMTTFAFGTPAEPCRDWLANKVGTPNLRVVADGGKVFAAGGVLPMGQFFGGRSVPMTGVAGVSVAPEHRGRGHSVALMSGILHELHAQGTPLSSLYPATSRLYRRTGYEQAGQHCEHRFPVAHLPARRSPASVRRFTEADLAGVKACQGHGVARADGALDRSDYIWQRVFHPRTGKHEGFVVDDASLEGGIGGYLFMRQEQLSTGRHDLHLSDLVASTPVAAESLLHFLGQFGSMAANIVVRAAAMHPLFTLLDEPRHLSIHFHEYWMLRIVHLERALTMRGYPAGLREELHLDIDDPLLPANAGRWVLEVRDGQGAVTRGGHGSLQASIGGLAQVYSGQFAPRSLACVGRVRGDQASLDVASRLFAGHGNQGFSDFF